MLIEWDLQNKTCWSRNAITFVDKRLLTLWGVFWFCRVTNHGWFCTHTHTRWNLDYIIRVNNRTKDLKQPAPAPSHYTAHECTSQTCYKEWFPQHLSIYTQMVHQVQHKIDLVFQILHKIISGVFDWHTKSTISALLIFTSCHIPCR